MQRDDGVAVLPDRLKGDRKPSSGSSRGSDSRREVRVRRDEPAWRQSDEEKPIRLKITSAGSAAVGGRTKATPSPSRSRQPGDRAEKRSVRYSGPPSVRSSRGSPRSRRCHHEGRVSLQVMGRTVSFALSSPGNFQKCQDDEVAKLTMLREAYQKAILRVDEVFGAGVEAFVRRTA